MQHVKVKSTDIESLKVHESALIESWGPERARRIWRFNPSLKEIASRSLYPSPHLDNTAHISSR